MHDQDAFVSALVRALDRDSSPEALRRAIAAIRVERGVSASRAYAILVRANAGCSHEPGESSETKVVPIQRQPLWAS